MNTFEHDQIYKIGCENNQRVTALKAIKDGASVDQYRESVESGRLSDFYSDRSGDGFSLVDLIYRVTYPQATDKRGRFELEVCELERDYQSGFGIGFVGLPVPNEFLSGRALTAGVSTGGGHTVADTISEDEFANFLYENTAALNMATRLTGLRDDVVIVTLDTRATAGFASGENVAGTEQTQVFDSITLTPKQARAFTNVSRTLIQQSSLPVEGIVRRDLAKAVGIAIDQAIVSGSGTSGNPTGLVNTANFNNTVLNTNIIEFSDLVALERIVVAQHADASVGRRMGWILDNVALEAVRKMNVGYEIYRDGMVLSYPAQVSSLLDDGSIIFGNWDDMIVGLWGATDLLIDPSTLSVQGMTRVVANQMMDCAPKRIESFARLVIS